VICGRESADRWARRAHHILDRARAGGAVSRSQVDWALVYLGDKEGDARIPRNRLKERHA